MKLEFLFQVSSISKSSGYKNKFVCSFLGEVLAWQFCFEIYWPLSPPLVLTRMEFEMINPNDRMLSAQLSVCIIFWNALKTTTLRYVAQIVTQSFE